MITAPKSVATELPKPLARSLAADRYFDFPDSTNDTGWRGRTVDRIVGGRTCTKEKLASWHAPAGFSVALTLAFNAHPPAFIKARLTSRLLVNLGGTPFENGGLSLDRISGVPFIPGSAVKGIARREAIITLRAAKVADKAAWLANIAEVFGWGPDDWKPGADFAKACGANWLEVSADASELICADLEMGRLPPAFRGLYAFLPAFPTTDSGIEADLVTCHHREYYDGSRTVATDDEQPVPIVFPAVKAGSDWTFPLLPLSQRRPELMETVRAFVAAGLRCGIGAKTNAGYGRFVPLGEDEAIAPELSATAHRFVFVTPCMCAGARQHVAELRVASLRGSLRWWFRAVDGTREEEREVFGGVAGKARASAISLELLAAKSSGTQWLTEVARDKSGRAIRFLQNPNADASYLWHFAAVANEEKRLWISGRKFGQPNLAGALPPESEFTLGIRWLRPVSEEAKKRFNLAWAAFCTLGAVGLRATRGMGSWRHDKAHPVEKLESLLVQCGFQIRISSDTFSSWKEAVSFAGGWLKRGLRNDFKVGGDDNGKNQNASPLGSSDPRQASAVQFRVLSAQNGRFRVVAFEAPHNRVLGEKSRRPRPILPSDFLQGPPPPDIKPRRY